MLNDQTRTAPWVVVPVKELAFAKQRLAPLLGATERREFFHAMLDDVLRALAGTPGLAGLMLVTRDEAAKSLARRYAARVLEDPSNTGHSQAVNHAARTLAAERVASMLTVPGDIPLLSVAEMGELLGAHGASPALSIAPAHDERGSNAVLCSPPDVIDFQFGNDSFQPHLAHARRAGIEPRVVKLPGIGLDIDGPNDLRRFAACASQTQSYRYLLGAGIVRRLAQDPACTVYAEG